MPPAQVCRGGGEAGDLAAAVQGVCLLVPEHRGGSISQSQTIERPELGKIYVSELCPKGGPAFNKGPYLLLERGKIPLLSQGWF